MLDGDYVVVGVHAGPEVNGFRSLTGHWPSPTSSAKPTAWNAVISQILFFNVSHSIHSLFPVWASNSTDVEVHSRNTKYGKRLLGWLNEWAWGRGKSKRAREHATYQKTWIKRGVSAPFSGRVFFIVYGVDATFAASRKEWSDWERKLFFHVDYFWKK